jgi:uncharacterized protein YndB with AHSA1/START domain
MTADAETGKVVVRRRIAATREELFAEWTDPESMRVWMCPGEVVSAEVRLDPRVGGSFLIIMRSPTQVFEHRGEFTVVDRPSKLAFTWIAVGTDLLPTLVTVEFFEAGEYETELVLTHEKFPRKEVKDRYESGWSQIVTRLEQHLKRRNKNARSN